ncbi:MAG: GAF domain-containing protein [Anaerolineales bacterium]|nr:GAF domain-containing protein [Anaerolineales bacterium]
MTGGQKTPRILIIDPAENTALKTSLETQYSMRVNHHTSGRTALDSLHQTRPDLIVLNAHLSDLPASSVLAELNAQNLATPIILVGANGEITRANFNDKNIVGWLNQPVAVAELAALIQSALERPLPNSDLVLTKRAEIVEANQQLTARVQQLQTLFEIGKSVTSQLELEEVLRRVAKAAVTLTNADESYLLLVTEGSGNLYLRAEANLGSEEVKNFWVKVSDSIAGRVVQTGEPIIISKESNNLKVKTGLVVNALVNVPVKVGSTVIGVLGVDNRFQQRAFTAEDQMLLSALADWAAIAIQNAKLYTATTELSRDLELVNEVSRLVSSTLDVEQIPRLLVQRTAEIFGAECGSLALLDKERGAVVFQLAYDDEGNELTSLKNFLMPLGEGIVGLVAQTGLPHVVNNVQSDPGWSPAADRLTGFKTKKIMAVPLIAEGEVVGVMELLNKKEGNFDEGDLQLLLLVAASAASALQNARQYSELQKANQALQWAQEQRIAAERWTVLGKAAGSLAHRINNTTTLVPIAVQHLRELLQPVKLSPELRKEVDENLERIERNTLYTVDLAVALLRRFRQHPAKAHNVNELINRALSLVEIPKNIKVVCHLDPDLPPVDTSDLLVDALIELITNALRVMAEPGGLLRVASFKVGDKIAIQVTDSGSGIAAENLDRVFDMFFTTQPQGLGFGLWWVKTFLEQQHGEITVESRPHEGTTFTILLPMNLPLLPSP